MADKNFREKILTEKNFQMGLNVLIRRDPDLAKVVEDFGPPPLWKRKPGFATLVHIILEQQVSLASARATLNKLMYAVSPLTPEKFLQTDADRRTGLGEARADGIRALQGGRRH